MCAIIGIASIAPVSKRGWVTAGRDAMQHRGPDDAGEWWSTDARVGLAHRRLAIIDLTPAGHQPMRDMGSDLCIVFNGEIYNFVALRQELAAKGHPFRSDSDTEVILAAYLEWGVECVSRLNGMFAFALYDRRQRTLFIARDRAGEKPLFYVKNGGELRFASELKGLLADPELPRRIDADALDCYLAMGFVPGEQCILAGVKKLPPAHALVFNVQNGDCRIWRYWRLPELEAMRDSEIPNEGLLLDELEALLRDAVRRQMVADVPVGILLSGGVDSSLVTAMAVRDSAKVKTFTIRFPGHGEHDETEHARLIARHFGTEHVELDACESTLDLLPILARQFDEPMADSSMIPTYLVSRLVRQHCTVVLGGDGGDELFGGYLHYNRLLWIHQYLGAIPERLRMLLGRAGGLLPIGFRGRKWLQGLAFDLRQGLPIVAAASFDRKARRALMCQFGEWSLAAESAHDMQVPRIADPLQRATRMDFESYLPNDILTKADRASMLNSLEVRAPFLDQRVIEFAFARVPSHLKATVTGRKLLLKQLTARILPPEFDRNRKQGFVIPLAAWLRSGEWRDFFREVLLGSQSTVFNHQAIRKLLAGQAAGLSNGDRLFSLVLFELWRREYQVVI